MTDAPLTADETAAPYVVGRGVLLAHGTHVALSDADFTIGTGTVTAVIGPNGSGKSTLLHGIAGLLDPVRGSIEVGGRRARARSVDVAYVLQSTRVHEHLPVTVREVVSMGRYGRRGLVAPLRREDRRAVDEAMERLAVADLAGRQIRELSGGQRQRVFVAQGLAQEATVLLLDEAVTGLDLLSHRRILDTAKEEADRGRVVIMTTHDLGEAAHADHVVLLAGRVVAEGPPAEVLTADHLADAYRQRLVRLEDNVLMLDDAPHHHDETGDVHPHPGHQH
ncbi:MAG: metal ABC transporter ATP-binding protein [Acidimicrobiales bacterium]